MYIKPKYLSHKVYILAPNLIQSQYSTFKKNSSNKKNQNDKNVKKQQQIEIYRNDINTSKKKAFSKDENNTKKFNKKENSYYIEDENNKKRFKERIKNYKDDDLLIEEIDNKKKRVGGSHFIIEIQERAKILEEIRNKKKNIEENKKSNENFCSIKVDMEKRKQTLLAKKLARQEKARMYYDAHYINVDFKLLEDFPAWLKGLSGHKFAPLFKGMKWQDIMKLSETQLRLMGVVAPVRRNMLKAFAHVQKALDEKKNNSIT